MKSIRIGIVGAGFGITGHLPALTHHPRFEVVAIASPASAPRAAREANVRYAFRSCAEMVAGCELDAVTVASPPFAHRDDVVAALDARKHVICEKPFTLRLADARALVAAEASARTACGVAHEFRFVPQMHALKELIANHHLDPLRNIEVTLLRSTLRRDERRPRSWWFERERGGGLSGAVLSHLIDLANFLAGRSPLQRAGFLRHANRQRVDEAGPFESTVDDAGFALLDYGEGLVARLCADGTTAVESFTAAVHGERRTAVVSGPAILDVTLFAVDRERTEELECKPSPYQSFARIHPNVPPLMELYDEFAKKIDGKPNALPSFADALATQETLAAIGYEL
jgi:predicted dehydrogenase